MKKGLVVALTQFTILSSPAFAQSPTKAPTPSSSWKIHFQELDINGSIIVLDLNSGSTYEHNQHRNKQQFLPASTLKILNVLITLETKVIPSSKTVFPWDGITRSIPEWNQELDMERGFQISTVWHY